MNGFVCDEHREKRAWSYTRTGGVTEGFRVRKWRSDGFARALFDGAAARKRFWVSSETSLIVEVRRTRENIGPTASFLAGTRAWRRTWGVEPPLLQTSVQALAPGKLLRRGRRRERWAV